jgi:hypothetical protein
MQDMSTSARPPQRCAPNIPSHVPCRCIAYVQMNTLTLPDKFTTLGHILGSTSLAHQPLHDRKCAHALRSPTPATQPRLARSCRRTSTCCLTEAAVHLAAPQAAVGRLECTEHAAIARLQSVRAPCGQENQVDLYGIGDRSPLLALVG